MYKVFIYDKPVYLTSNAILEVKNCQQLKVVNVDKILSDLKQEDVEGIVVVIEDVEEGWNEFKSHFKFIEAAGGVVYNPQDEMLFIHRFGKWDLPKGKREKGEGIEECAVREVEEECNVEGLTVEKQLPSTYHCYPYKGKWALKITYWFDMNTKYKGELIPQTEEGIEKVEWRNPEKLKKVYKNTYKSIIEVLNNTRK